MKNPWRNWADGVLEPDEEVKCGCGLVMRYADWPGHWDGCEVAMPVELTLYEVIEFRKAFE